MALELAFLAKTSDRIPLLLLLLLLYLLLLLHLLVQLHNMIVGGILARLTEAEIDDGFIIVVLGGGVGVGGSSVDSACG